MRFIVKNLLIIVLILYVFLTGCAKLFTDPGPQPSFFEEEDFEPILNLFGVLRPGIPGGAPLSFIRLEGSYSVTWQYPETTIVKNAIVKLFQVSDNTQEEIAEFFYNDKNYEYRPVEFYPQAGYTYGISCRSGGYPELTAETTVPYVPEIGNNSVSTAGSKLKFTIARDALAALYDVYFLIGERKYTTRIFRPEEGDIDVELNYVQGTESEGQLIIYAYDLNLSEYLSTTIVIKPNTYQPYYSTVENGYGSFGSLNVLERAVEF